jgi:hypothetical protein
MFIQILLAYIVASAPASTSNFTCPTTFNPNVCTATRYDLNFGTTCCKTVGYVYSKTGCVVRDASHNPLKC